LEIHVLACKKKVEKKRTLLNSWIYWDLAYMGNITVIKSLAMPILIQFLNVLPNPLDNITNEIQYMYLLYWSINNVFHGDILNGSNILFIHAIFSPWQNYSICSILSHPSSYWPIITFLLILSGFPLTP
jgi:hypothetical protein